MARYEFDNPVKIGNNFRIDFVGKDTNGSFLLPAGVGPSEVSETEMERLADEACGRESEKEITASVDMLVDQDAEY